MASKSLQGGSELRIVILGNAGEEKAKAIKSVLNCENLTQEEDGLCTLYKTEQAGRKISVVEAPGWDKLSIPDRIKQEIVRSVSLCHPGPHTLLLVIPVKTPSSVEEIEAAEMHMKLLSKRVWKHTIVLFACDEGVKEPAIQEHIHSTEKILEKYGRLTYVLQKSTCESPTQIQELLKKIDGLVEENRGDFFIPQAYYELIQKKAQEASGVSELRQRRGSADSPPNLEKDKGDDKGDSEEKKETVENAKHSKDTSKISMDFKQFILILMIAIGALLGSVAGAENGVRGSFIGIVIGIFVGVLVASFIMYIYTHIYSSTDPKQPTQSAS